jgi:hypothetical protein
MSEGNGTNLLTQGRIVWVGGSLFEGKQKKNFQTNQPEFNADGTPVVEYGFGLAIPKLDPATNQNTQQYTTAYQTLYNEAMTLFNGATQLPNGFPLKIKDGDVDVDRNGNPLANKEGYKNHIVIACTTRIPPKFYVWQNGENVLTNQGIKCGDYVNVQLNVKAHPAKGQGKAGLYVNPVFVQLVAAGKAIINAPSGDEVFGNTAPSYAGQMEVDTGVQAPGAAALPPQGLPQQGLPQQGQAPAQGFPAADPNYNVLPGHIMNPQQGQAPAQGLPQTNNQLPQQGLPGTHTPTPGAQMPAVDPNLQQANVIGGPQLGAPGALPQHGMPTP